MKKEREIGRKPSQAHLRSAIQHAGKICSSNCLPGKKVSGVAHRAITFASLNLEYIFEPLLSC